MNKIHDDEIGLFEIIITIWNEKFKLISIIIVFVIGVSAYHFIKPTKSIATISISPINQEEADRYHLFNSLDYYDITPRMLYNHYLKQIDNQNLIQKVIRELNLIDAKKYENVKAFNQAIANLALKVEFFPKIYGNNNLDDIGINSKIVFTNNDMSNSKEILSLVNSYANQSVKEYIIGHFQTIIATSIYTKEYAIEKAEIRIANALNDYDTITYNKLKFLKEQASMARELDLDVSAFPKYINENGVIVDFLNRANYYLRGYVVIEEEISLIESREDKTAFIPSLLELMQLKREIEENKHIENIKKFFSTSPILSDANFTAVSFNVDKITIEKKEFIQFKIQLLLATLIGGIVGMIYIIFTNSFRNYKQQHTKIL